MADDDDIRYGATDDEDDELEADQTEDRSEELVRDHDIKSECIKAYSDIEKGYSDQWERSNDQMDYWDVYNCTIGPKQFYSGNSKIFVPIVKDAIDARKTRFVNQIFPTSGKHIEITGSEGKPQALMSLLEFYIRKCKLRTKIMPPLLKNGDVEGQYTLLVGWTRNERHVAMRVKRKPTIDGMEIPHAEGFDDIKEETIIHEYPKVEVIPDADLLVLPSSAESIEEAIEEGGSVTIQRRWSKAKIRSLIREGEIDQEEGEALIKAMSEREKDQIPDKKSKSVDAAGIKYSGKKSTAHVYETWMKLKIDGDRRIVRIYYGGPDHVLSVKRNPYWCDKVPILSAPVDKVEGSFKGVSKIKPVETFQYAANDAVNEGMDAAAYALLPIIMTDPLKNPKIGSMVLNVAAVWETNPKDTQFAQFPPLWKDAFQIVASAKDQVFQTLGVNPAMMPQQVMAPGKKPNQAQIANEQMVDILTTADSVTVLEGEILSPLMQWFLWLDHQFRDETMTVRAFGRLGVQAEMERIEPVQMDRRFEVRWYGVEAARNQQQMQAQMAGLNVIMRLPPQSYAPYKLNLAPVLEQFVENLFGPRLGPRVFEDQSKQLTLEPMFENQLLAAGFDLPVAPMDNDQQHMQAHAQAMQAGDWHGTIRAHMQKHQQQMQLKQQAMIAGQVQALMGAAQQAQRGGGGPRPGAQTGGPRPMGQGPAGMIHRDRMAIGPPRSKAR